MKVIELKTVERLALISHLNKIESGDRRKLGKIFKLVDQLDFSEDEKKELAIVQDGKSIKWNNEKDSSKEFKIEDGEFDIVSDRFRELDRTKKMPNNRVFVELYDKVMEIK